MSKQREQKAWAVVDKDGKISMFYEHMDIFATAEHAKEDAAFGGQRVVPCLITWREESGK